MLHQKKLNEVLATSRMYTTLENKKPWSPLTLNGERITPLVSSTTITTATMQLYAEPNMTSHIPPSTATGEHLAAIKQLLGWVNANVCVSRPFRSQQLYLWGPPRTGKTSFLRLLDTMLRIYYMPGEGFYDQYDDDNYDLIVMDEFGPTHDLKPIQEYNKWLDGQVMALRKKGSQGLKTRNLPFIFVSNFPPERVYHKVFGRGELEPFTSRLLVVEIKQMIPLDLIVPIAPPIQEEAVNQPMNNPSSPEILSSSQ